MLVHGYRSSGRIWRLVQEALDPTRFRSLALSNRGAGDSERTAAEADYTVESLRPGPLRRDAKLLGRRDFTLVGHSMGGARSTQFALDHPELRAGPGPAEPCAAGRPCPVRELGATDSGGVRQRVECRRMWRRTLPHVPEEFRQALQADIARNPIERALGGRRSMASLRLRQRLQELPMPVCVVGGDQDTTVGVHNILAEYLALPEAPASSCTCSTASAIRPTWRWPRAAPGVLDRLRVPDGARCLASGRSLR